MGCCRRVGVHPSEGVNFTLILTFSPQGRRDLSLRGNDGGEPPLHPSPVTLILAFSPQGRRDLSLRGNDGGCTGSDGVRLC